ncbi:Protein FAM173B [Trichoplax sp. H2]|uniref:Methyltransferase domain-containing protein n=1 Tax=Trichoplax adhaerens TaxID=10228 RepID=B3RPI1_TRIAD|nr:hypothetical protein TRIADDRAFT_20586 [Trichoplax adhaerens]EDV27641.1 hypothetical protein TRIADDRAFT_20586 [Trichoplax adhaerens]RDD45252.1 Protein FAM173B [Trichoplax sp. H2]|eukprot:XP_002109475.1 hypothetical protein TRIADDRAFT_20586 [Trichoplax adhaerens]
METDRRTRNRKIFGYIAVGTCGAIATAVCMISWPFITPAFRRYCLPYVPATTEQVSIVLKLCRPGRLVDLGSGDGRIVIAAAREGHQAFGYELNRWLVLYSKIKARMEGMHTKTLFRTADLWKIDLSTYDNIVIFGVPSMMKDLEKKIKSEMHPRSHVIACRFCFPSWDPVDIIEGDSCTAWLYKSKRCKDDVKSKVKDDSKKLCD